MDYDAELQVREAQLEGLDGIEREHEYKRHFYEEMFREIMVDLVAQKVYVRELAVDKIELEDVRIAGRYLIGRQFLHQVGWNVMDDNSSLIKPLIPAPSLVKDEFPPPTPRRHPSQSRIQVTVFSIAAYVACLLGVVLMYIWYASQISCLLNLFFITFTVVLIHLMTCVSLHSKIKAGFLTPSLMGLYVVFICWCAIRSEPPTDSCKKRAETSARADWLTIISFILALLVMVIATFSTGIDSKSFQVQFRNDEVEKEDDVPYGYGFFHFVFAMGAMYFAMLLIGWNSHHTMRKWTIDVGWTSTWVRIVNEWLAACVYIVMVSSPINEASTSGRSVESEIKTFESEEEVGVDQFSDFPERLVSYFPRLDVFKEFCKANISVRGRWGNCIKYAGKQFRGCTVAKGEEYFYLLADLAKEKRDRGIDESISLEYFDGNVQSELSEGFLCYLSLLEYGLSLPLSNLAKWIMNLIGACPVQMNGNMWEVISVCDSLNIRWEGDGRRRRISSKDILQFYGVARKDSLLDIVAQEEMELEAVLEEFGICRKKRVNSRAEKVQKSQSTRLITSTDGRSVKAVKKRRVEPSDMSGLKVVEDRPIMEDNLKEVEVKSQVARLMKGMRLGVKEERAELKKKNVKL
ncbi:hypothetical protein GIB67_012525 [Kingdonia uniflora]|uniref:Uncharacterized protein n=1 Tax=Kingdonia uniflora TaxID=39325 RepID=A0A7J7N5G3_9MAGN|nr:hypothetical protein GIB67_012525 [Kingdonia uniflora]